MLNPISILFLFLFFFSSLTQASAQFTSIQILGGNLVPALYDPITAKSNPSINALAISSLNGFYLTGGEGINIFGDQSIFIGANVYVAGTPLSVSSTPPFISAESITDVGILTNFATPANFEIYYAGNFDGPSFNPLVFPSPSSVTLTSSSGSSAGYVVGLNTANPGVYNWTTMIGGDITGPSVKINAIDVLTTVNIAVAGEFSGTMTVGSTTLTSNGGTDMFVVFLDRNTGVPLSAFSAGGACDDSAKDVEFGIAVGYFDTSAPCGSISSNVPGTNSIINPNGFGGRDLGILYTNTANITQVIIMGGPGNDEIHSITPKYAFGILISGIVLGGTYNGTINMDFAVGGNQIVSSVGTNDIFVASYDSSPNPFNFFENLTYLKSYGSPSSNYENVIVSAAPGPIGSILGKTYVAATVSGGPVTYGPSFTLGNSGGKTIHLLKINFFGIEDFAEELGFSFFDDRVVAIKRDPNPINNLFALQVESIDTNANTSNLVTAILLDLTP